MVHSHRSYLEGLKRGYLTQDPSKYHNPNVCAPYRKAAVLADGSSHDEL